MKKVTFAILGTGMIAEFHAQAIQATPSARLALVYDTVPERAGTFAEKFQLQTADRLEDILNRSDIDAVTIATPSGTHMDLALAAAQARKHILCEKPLEVTLERTDRIIHTCNQHQVKLGCFFQARTGAGVHRLRQELLTGRFGKMVLFNAHMKWYRSQEYYDSGQWRGTWKLDGGGALMNQAIHIIDLLLFFAGEPKQLHAYTKTLTHTRIEVEDTAVAAVEFANGALGTIVASTSCAPGFPRRLEITGENGTAALEDDKIVQWAFTDKKPYDDQILADAQSSPLKAGAGDPKAISFLGHQRLVEDFVHALCDHRDPMITGPEGRKAIALIEAIYQSARSGKPYIF